MRASNPHRIFLFGLAALLLASWAAVSAWIVQREGQAYRRTSRESIAAGPGPDSPRERPPARPSTEDVPPAPVRKVSVPSPIEVARAKAAPAPEVERATERSTPVEVQASKGTSGGPPIDPFWLEPEQKKMWDLDRLTAEDEHQLGASLHRMILRFHPPVEVGPLPKRLEDAAEPYLKSRDRKDVTYTFTVLDCAYANAFSLPGGYIYVCRGLFDWIADDEDYALEFIVAHEIAHVDKAHAIACLRDPEVKKLNLGTLPLFNFVVIPWGYKEAQDFEADRWASDRMAKLGRSRYEAMAFLRKLDDFSKKNGFENVRKKPTDKPKIPFLDNHIRAHPIPRNRLKALSSTTADPPKS